MHWVSASPCVVVKKKSASPCVETLGWGWGWLWRPGVHGKCVKTPSIIGSRQLLDIPTLDTPCLYSMPESKLLGYVIVFHFSGFCVIFVGYMFVCKLCWLLSTLQRYKAIYSPWLCRKWLIAYVGLSTAPLRFHRIKPNCEDKCLGTNFR